MSNGEGEDTSRVVAEVSEETHELAKQNAEYGEISEAIRDTIDRLAYPDDVTSRDEINNRLRELRAERDEKRVELERVTGELKADIDKLETKIARLEERKDGTQSKADKFEGAVEQLATTVEEGKHIWKGHPNVKAAAETIEEPQEYVLEQVRDRVPDADPELFEEKDIYNGRRK